MQSSLHGDETYHSTRISRSSSGHVRDKDFQKNNDGRDSCVADTSRFSVGYEKADLDIENDVDASNSVDDDGPPFNGTMDRSHMRDLGGDMSGEDEAGD